MFFVSLVLLALCSVALAGDFVADNRIKVFLYGFPSFFSEVAVDVYNNTCLGLGNNLIDGHVQSILVGGPNVDAVLSRSDCWYCMFYDNYGCSGTDDMTLTIPAGVNNLASAGWGARIHSISCINEAA
ncbi:hypothetical protein BU26DRAFT_437837 [Trematosphaeria pertusa]|uniref:Uncharacterized protein n=1 Tax=Trematosphaeria pertusa TaxID=390896 RepID=A0A6A6HYP4_9PLEO|nr:uncharacterized protein BU26DRAFT_437837 [Trematosphaeria pertusa]KAF2243147.1 hypothetical protein BU26DRAFT_437837 [Trematosphaeria pertusa]